MIAPSKPESELSALVELWSCMVHPEDVERRSQLRAYLHARMCEAASRPVPADLTGPLIGAAARGAGSDMTDAVTGGCLAGETLLTALQLRASGIEHPGIEKAQYLVAELSRRWVSGQGTRYRANRETIRKVHWRKYRRVAHLWAAYLILLDEAEQAGRRDAILDWLNPIRLAEIANGIRLYDKGDYLPADALELLGVGAASVAPPDLYEWVHQSLRSYRPRARGS